MPPKPSRSHYVESAKRAREATAAKRAAPVQEDEVMPSADEEPAPRRTPRSVISNILFPKQQQQPQKARPNMQEISRKARAEQAEKREKRRKSIEAARDSREQHGQTIAVLTEEAVNEAETAQDLEEDLIQAGETRNIAFGNVIRECEVKDVELERALKQLEIISGQQKKLINDKKAATMALKREMEKHQNTNKNMQRKVDRRDFYHQQARKPFTELASRNSRYEAVKRFLSIVTTFFSCYLFIDFFTISRIAWPNIKTPFSMLSAAQTWQFMNELNISFTKMRVIKRFFKQCGMNIFASEGHVYELIKTVANATKSFVKQVQLSSGKPTQIKCASIESLKELIKQRIIAQLKGGKFPKWLKHLRLCIGFDKGGTTTKMCLMMGSIKGRNGPRNMSLLALYEGNETPEELKAAFQKILDECKKLKRIRIGHRTIKVSFKFTGDLKCLKACLGLLSGNANYPCLYCLQKKETTFGNYSEPHGPPRERYDDKDLPGQGHIGCLSWIKPRQIVLPSLHIMMGVAEKIFDLLISRICIVEAITDFNGFDMDELRNDHEKFAVASEELKTERERLNDWQSIKENYQGTTLTANTLRWPHGCGPKRWFGDICCSSNCISEVVDIALPRRNSPAVGDDVPDWICVSTTDMWFHSVCLGLSTEEAIVASKIEDFDPVLKPKESILLEIEKEIQKSEANVRQAQKDVEAQLQKINLPKQFDNHPTVNALFKLFESLGAYKTAFFQRFTGNHIRALLEAAVPEDDGTSKLEKKLAESDSLKCFIDETHEKYDKQFNLGINALYLLASIQDMFKADFLSDSELEKLREKVKALESVMKDLPEVRVGHKFHLLLKHVPTIADRDKTIGFFSEHGIESMHALVNKLMQRLTIRTNETRLERIIQFVNSVAATRDQYGEIDPLKRKKLKEENTFAASALDMLDEDDGEEEYNEDYFVEDSEQEDEEEEEEEETEDETITIDLSELSL